MTFDETRAEIERLWGRFCSGAEDYDETMAAIRALPGVADVAMRVDDDRGRLTVKMSPEVREIEVAVTVSRGDGA